jgi:uncharacterized protein involved in exopolysaccharide biosynthesis
MLRFTPALWRYKWLILSIIAAITAASFGAGWSAIPLVYPRYEAGATIQVDVADGSSPGRIRPTKLSSFGL